MLTAKHVCKGPVEVLQTQVAACAGTCSAEDAGWLLAVCFDAAQHRSEVVVLDAQHISEGPVAVLPLRNVLPHGLHGCWHDVYLGPS